MSLPAHSPSLSPKLPSLASKLSVAEIRARLSRRIVVIQSLARSLLIYDPHVLEERDTLVGLIHDMATTKQRQPEERVHRRLIEDLCKRKDKNYNEFVLTHLLPYKLLQIMAAKQAVQSRDVEALKSIKLRHVNESPKKQPPPTSALRTRLQSITPSSAAHGGKRGRPGPLSSKEVVTLSSDDEEEEDNNKNCTAAAPSTFVAPPPPVKRGRKLALLRPPNFFVSGQPPNAPTPTSYLLKWSVPNDVQLADVESFHLYYRRVPNNGPPESWQSMTPLLPCKTELTINRLEAGRFELGLTYETKQGQTSMKAVQPIRF